MAHEVFLDVKTPNVFDKQSYPFISDIVQLIKDCQNILLI